MPDHRESWISVGEDRSDGLPDGLQSGNAKWHRGGQHHSVPAGGSCRVGVADVRRLQRGICHGATDGPVRAWRTHWRGDGS